MFILLLIMSSIWVGFLSCNAGKKFQPITLDLVWPWTFPIGNLPCLMIDHFSGNLYVAFFFVFFFRSYFLMIQHFYFDPFQYPKCSSKITYFYVCQPFHLFWLFYSAVDTLFLILLERSLDPILFNSLTIHLNVGGISLKCLFQFFGKYILSFLHDSIIMF